MATSTINLYLVDFNQSFNCRVDDFENYLQNKLIYTFENFQYIKNQMNISIKLNLDQSATTYNLYNYVSIFNSDDEHIFYYFVISSAWLSQNTIQLNLSLDTINTFWNNLAGMWKNTTHITRQHKDRFLQAGSLGDVLTRKIDAFDEGINTNKVLTAKKEINYNTDIDTSLDWYLIYKTERPIQAGDTDNPLHCYMCANKRIKLQQTGVTTTLNASAFNGQCLYFTKQDNALFDATFRGRTLNFTGNQIAYILESFDNMFYLYDIEFWGNEYLISGPADSAASVTIKNAMLYRNAPILNFNLFDIMNYQTNYLLIAQGEAASVKSIDEIDRKDSSIMKIMLLPGGFPACAVDSIDDYYYFDTDKFIYRQDLSLLEATSLTNEFESSIQAQQADIIEELVIAKPLNLDTTLKNINYESKLYNSNFYSIKYQFQDFCKEFLLERWNALAGRAVYVTSKPSNTINAKTVFKVEADANTYTSLKLYDEYVIIDTDTSLTQYNNEYLNFLRNGWSYAKEKERRDIYRNLLGISKTGVIGAFTGGNLFGIFGTVATEATNTIYSAIDAEKNLQEKINELTAQSGNITNSDVNLLKYMTNNRICKATFDTTEQVKKALFNLFYLTGYADNSYEIPNFNSRRWFNFIQCEPKFKNDMWNYSQDFLNDIKERFAAGLTIYHKNNNTYDFDHIYENFESWLN